MQRLAAILRQRVAELLTDRTERVQLRVIDVAVPDQGPAVIR